MAMGCFGSPLLGTGGMPESQIRVKDSRNLQTYKAFEEATGSLTDIILGSETITV